MAKKNCPHPFAAIIFDNIRKPVCTKCTAVLTYSPDQIDRAAATPDLVTAVRSFLGHVKAADAGEQLNPRAELQLILTMSDALHELDRRSEEATE